MKVRGVVAEDFVNYKMPSMFITSAVCDWKCCTEQNIDTAICQNQPLMQVHEFEASPESLFELFTSNDITKAVVIGGLEPMLQFDEVREVIRYFREHGENCPFVIYTGYYPFEIEGALGVLQSFRPVIVKFGRYRPDLDGRYDEVLGVTLASSNQYAEEI